MMMNWLQRALKVTQTALKIAPIPNGSGNRWAGG
jgi:hypothetical protein